MSGVARRAKTESLPAGFPSPPLQPPPAPRIRLRAAIREVFDNVRPIDGEPRVCRGEINIREQNRGQVGPKFRHKLDVAIDTGYGITMKPRIVIDSSVLISGLMSRRGTSYRLLQLIGRDRFTTVLSVPLVVEYQKVILDPEHGLLYSSTEIERFIDYFCAVSERRKVYFLWRPLLRDPTDDMVLEAAVTGCCSYIVTFNTKDFPGIEKFGIRALWPGAFLEILEEKK